MQDDETGEPPLAAHEGDTTTAEGGPPDRGALESRAPQGASPAGERAQDAPVLPPDEIRAVLEALIFASPQPLTAREIGKVLGGVPKEAWAAAVGEIRADYARDGRGLQLVEIAAGYQITTRPEYNDWVRELLDPRAPTRLSIQALETLAVIAYKQPVTVPEISEIRGVDAGGVIATLLDRKLITTSGRKEVIGRPILYKTTKEFLLRFGLKDVNELPSMEEFEKLISESFQSDLLPAEAQAQDAPSESSGLQTDASVEAGKTA